MAENDIPRVMKDFEGWLPVKEKLDGDDKIPTFREREIWWCSTGVNVGVEQDGKNILYERPVLVVHKFNRRLSWGLPITSKIKEFPFYHPIHYKGANDAAQIGRASCRERVSSPV